MRKSSSRWRRISIFKDLRGDRRGWAILGREEEELRDRGKFGWETKTRVVQGDTVESVGTLAPSAVTEA